MEAMPAMDVASPEEDKAALRRHEAGSLDREALIARMRNELYGTEDAAQRAKDLSARTVAARSHRCMQSKSVVAAPQRATQTAPTMASPQRKVQTSMARVLELQLQHFADDVAVPAEAVQWSEDSVCRYFESGGLLRPCSTGALTECLTADAALVVGSAQAAGLAPNSTGASSSLEPGSSTSARSQAKQAAARRAHAIRAHKAVSRILRAGTRDWRLILGIAPAAKPTADDVTRAFRKQSLLVHPDKNAAPEALEAFKRLQAACDALRGTSTRPAAYGYAPHDDPRETSDSDAEPGEFPDFDYGEGLSPESWARWKRQNARREAKEQA